MSSKEDKVPNSFDQVDSQKDVTSLYLSPLIKRLTHGMFASYPNLKKITITSSVEVIDFDFAIACNTLSEIDVESNHPKYASINGILYDKSCKTLIRCPTGKRGTIIIPEGVEVIGIGAFNHCNKTRNISLPSSLKVIENGAFAICENLVSITIPDTVKVIPYCAFFFCFSLETIYLPKGLKSIQERAFSCCPSLLTITIPKSTSHIGENAFQGCTSLLIEIERLQKPRNWSKRWNSLNRPVRWQ